MHLSRPQLATLILIKIAYAFFAVLVFARFTSLGDTQDYLTGEYIDRNNVASTAYLMSVIGNAVGKGGGFIISVGLSVTGIVYLLEKARLSARDTALTFMLTALPSFGVWTSVFSKEVFVLFSFCLCTGGLIEMVKRRRRFFSLAQLAGLALLTFMKPHYSLSIYLSLAGMWTYYAGCRRELMLALMIVILAVITGLCIRYVDEIYQYTQIMPLHFSQSGGSTRHNTFWLDEWDFFTYLPVGVPVAFIGPTLPEAFHSPKLIPSFIEGCLLFGFIAVNGRRAVFYRKQLNVMGLLLMLSFVLVLFLTHYPFGLFNPGSAVRYRSGFILPLCVFVLFLAARHRPLTADKTAVDQGITEDEQNAGEHEHGNRPHHRPGIDQSVTDYGRDQRYEN